MEIINFSSYSYPLSPLQHLFACRLALFEILQTSLGAILGGWGGTAKGDPKARSQAAQGPKFEAIFHKTRQNPRVKHGHKRGGDNGEGMRYKC